MSTAPPSLSIEYLWEELWISLTSLLRSYAAVHGLNAGWQPEVESSGNRIVIRHHRRSLELSRTGSRVDWLREDGSNGTLELTEAGRLRGDSGEEEMDMAAEAWLREVVNSTEATR